MSLIALGVVMLVFAVLFLADNLLKIEASKHGLDTKGKIGLFPSMTGGFNKRAPGFANGAKFVGLKKGHDIKLVGQPAKGEIENATVNRYAIKPTDFLGISL